MGLGINDYTELIISPDSNNSDPMESPLGPFKVIRVDNSKSVVISIDVNDENNNKNQLIDIQKIISAVKQGRVTMKKVKIVKLNSLLNFYDYFLLLFYSILSNEIFRILYIHTWGWNIDIDIIIDMITDIITDVITDIIIIIIIVIDVIIIDIITDIDIGIILIWSGQVKAFILTYKLYCMSLIFTHHLFDHSMIIITSLHISNYLSISNYQIIFTICIAYFATETLRKV